ncbi:5-(carboxyamino)imidazole ribonucleotide synthase [Janibacter hoylei]|uniref:5-(carboxyamino)imidazole ribonucleotide synthase n=1 Tax=Janibacter hoylei TaxID=364298 RepID=UPI0021A3583E|nr:5-(carboxyamino)imidazole ribonucleotide synthase [Janibacter hoylei]MCT1619721.1 5-(carboxyamino)imidazole ribonucleotide synthase [Janibacter hoylei]
MSTPLRSPGGFPVVGIIGGGQLARMCAGPAAELGVTLAVLAEAPDASAALVTPFAPVGDHTDVETVRDFARHCDVITFDHEHVPPPVIEALVADGVAVHPTPEALLHAQDKLVMRRALTEAGVPCPRWTQAATEEEVTTFVEAVGWPVVVKTPRGGYDGKGVALADTVDDVRDWLSAAAERGEALLLEERVPFVRELSVLLARSPSGQAAAWPVVETVQTDGICTEVIAPAPDLEPEAARAATLVGLDIAAALEVTGVMAVELFELADGSVVVNELAMRPHNSGHWSMDGAVTGQFEQHLRAVLDLPLGSPRAREPWTVMGNVLGGEPTDLYPTYRHLMARDPELKVHLYGKGVRPGRKIGHVNVSGSDLADLRERARHAADYIQGVIDE